MKAGPLPGYSLHEGNVRLSKISWRTILSAEAGPHHPRPYFTPQCKMWAEAGNDRGAGSVFKLGGGGGRGRPGFHGMQLPITHRVLVIRGAATSWWALRTHKVVSSRSVCEGQLFAGTPPPPKNFSNLGLYFKIWQKQNNNDKNRVLTTD